MPQQQNFSDPFKLPGGNVDINGKAPGESGYDKNQELKSDSYKIDIPTGNNNQIANPNSPVAVYRTDPTTGGVFPTPIGTITNGVNFIANPAYLAGAGNPQALAIRKAEQRAIRAQTSQINKQFIAPTAKKLGIPNPVGPQPATTPQVADPESVAAITDEMNNPTNKKFTVPSPAVKMRMEYGDLFYPQTITRDQQDRIIFTMFKYEPATFNSKPGAQIITREIKTPLGTVTLPIQPSISDSNSVDWSGGTINSIQAVAAGGSLKMMNSTSPGQFLDKGLDLVKQAGYILANNSDAMKIYLAQEAVGVQNLLSRTTGAILNPNMELLFNGPSLRPFAFTFRLSARDNTEATQIRQIIRFFKQGMAVRKTEGNIFLKAPNVFGIDYKTFIKGKLNFHPSLNRIKKCALIACDVDYTPDGTYMTFNDTARTITSYQISLRFSELEPIYQSDYSDDKGNAAEPYKINSDEIGF